MEYPFDALHAGIESQILNLPAGIPDSEAVTQAKALPDWNVVYSLINILHWT